MLGLSHDRHTGRLLPHRQTSYGGLAVLLTVTGSLAVLVTLAIGTPSRADTSSGSIGVTATVSGAPPSTAPVISSPKDGTTVASAQITVSGPCDAGHDYTVVVTDNGVVRGSAFCGSDGSFSLTMSLIPGHNLLAAHYVDSLNQSGPNSATVMVVYQPVAGAVAAPAAVPSGSKLAPQAKTVQPTIPGALLSVTAPYRFDGLPLGNKFSLTGDLEGGSGPYALEVDWGDNSQNLLSRGAAGTFTLTHNYSKAGRYTIRLNASDVTGASATFQTVLGVIGVGAAQPAAPANPPVAIPPYELAIVWPLFLMVCLVALSFWLGEHYDRHHWHPLPPTM